LVGLALPAAAQVGASIGLDIFGSRSNTDLEGRSLIGLEVILDGEPLCFLHTDSLTQMAGVLSSRVSYRATYAVVGLDRLRSQEDEGQVSLFLPTMGDEAEALRMRRAGEQFVAGRYRKGGVEKESINVWQEKVPNEFLRPGPNLLFFTVIGRFDHKSGITGGDRRGSTTALSVLDLTQADLQGLSRQEVFSRWFGYWTPVDEELLLSRQSEAAPPATSTPQAPQEIDEQQLTTLLADIDLTGLETGLADIASATREGNEVNAEVFQLLAENQERIIELLSQQETAEEAPSEPIPPTTSQEEILNLTLADSGRQLRSGERLPYAPGLKLVAHMSRDEGVITSSLELPGKVSDSQTFSFSGGQEPIWFRGLSPGTWRLSVNYSDGDQSQTVVVYLEVK
jgi:hypothetical protein